MSYSGRTKFKTENNLVTQVSAVSSEDQVDLTNTSNMTWSSLPSVLEMWNMVELELDKDELRFVSQFECDYKSSKVEKERVGSFPHVVNSDISWVW